jgi:hypothetical protein
MASAERLRRFVRGILHADMNTISTEPLIEVAVQLSLRELFKASVAITRIAFARLLIIFSVISVFSLGLGVWALALSIQHRPLPSNLGTLPTFWTVFFPPLFLALLLYGSPYLSARNLWKNSSNIRGVSRYSFSERGVDIQSPTARAELQWASFVTVRETSDFFLLYVRKSMAHIVPKRAFASEADVTAFRALVRNHIKSPSLRG